MDNTTSTNENQDIIVTGNNKILIDTRGIVNPLSAKEANLVFRGLGRG